MLTRALLQQRRTLAALTIGAYRSIDSDNPACFVYERQYDDQRCLVALNFSGYEQVVKLPGYSSGRIVLSTYMDGGGTLDLPELRLRCNEGILVEIRSN